MIPLPDGIEFREWSSRIVEDFSLDGVPYDLPWKEFGARLLTYPTFHNLPGPYAFDDWREWARRCMTFFL